MTENEWLTATDPGKMWSFVEGIAGERRLRLVACACCRHVWHLLGEARSRPAVEAAELLADGLLTREEVAQITLQNSFGYSSEQGTDDYSVASSALASHGAVMRTVPSLAAALVEKSGRYRELETRFQAKIVRDIFGNPFHFVSVNPSWLTSAVVAIAKQMYESHDFSGMPVLADALQEADCTDEEILKHCRGPGPHVRGCWVIDLLLGKE